VENLIEVCIEIAYNLRCPALVGCRALPTNQWSASLAMLGGTCMQHLVEAVRS
jgi:hypothetical protein